MTATIVETPVDVSTVDARVVRRRLGPGRRIPFAFWIGPALILAIWSAGSATGLIPPAILTAPWDVVIAFEDQWVNHDLLGNILASLERAVLGLALGVVTGAALAVISGLSRIGESLVDGPIQIKRSVPTLALIPLFIAWFGIGEEMKVLTIALITLVPIYVHTHNGLRSIDGKYAELAETIGIGRGAFVRHIVLPGALPGFLLGMRFAVTSSMLGLVVVEQYNAVAGVGHMITLAEQYGQTDVIVVGLVIYGVFGYCADAAVRLTGRKVLAWRRTLED
ncbi:putative ABC transporter permease protein [Actinoplanes missouriensis 431]|uniref:Putative ABC transporter permease protein n=1 Tax=Actinoplanes missouriensis (strain ATCC 14538 / DSM 43046 / CBS 188.64 / JCM 3121 / NBRC 102363 / NCIMB 12654 / NRRL B-3342 / UNCC 431) TaxID=512565 RepID=I0H847_ACTM4|nr:ABC transporter permease [Actinoplanes missouriensis]BAL89184.1 putative ABC transporter permease protein [Actinoplanes missouriensis 431]